MTETETPPAGAVAEPRWGFADVVGAFLFAQVASAVGFAVFAVVRGAGSLDLDSLTIGEIAVLQIPLWLGLLGVPLLSVTRRGNGPRHDLGLWMRRSDAPKGLALGVACQFVLVPLVTLPVFLLSDADQADLEAPARELTDKASGLGVLVLALVVVIAAPLAEEVFFRGLLQRTLVRRFPVWPSMIVTSIVFGISHFQVLQFPALAAFGLVLSVAAHRTGRLGLSIWAHVGFNATTVVALLVAG